MGSRYSKEINSDLFLTLQIRIIPAIKEQLQKLPRPTIPRGMPRRTLKTKRAETAQAEGLAAVRSILDAKPKNEPVEVKCEAN